eukprot:15443344-Alexandrium_andersonii.AAC.1
MGRLAHCFDPISIALISMLACACKYRVCALPPSRTGWKGQGLMGASFIFLIVRNNRAFLEPSGQDD